MPAASTAAKDARQIRFQAWPRPVSIEDVISAKELAEQSLLTGLPLLRRILGQGPPLIEAGLIDSDGLKAAVTELEAGPQPCVGPLLLAHQREALDLVVSRRLRELGMPPDPGHALPCGQGPPPATPSATPAAAPSPPGL